jgi:hypothetical protein
METVSQETAVVLLAAVRQREVARLQTELEERIKEAIQSKGWSGTAEKIGPAIAALVKASVEYGEIKVQL